MRIVLVGACSRKCELKIFVTESGRLYGMHRRRNIMKKPLVNVSIHSPCLRMAATFATLHWFRNSGGAGFINNISPTASLIALFYSFFLYYH